MDRRKRRTAEESEREEQERALDEALEESFPASDPPSPVQPHRASDTVDADELTS